MLIRFNVKNFLSFSEREDGKSEEFSMIAGKVRSKKEHVYDDGKIKLLKFAAVYGANAAGKSNLVKALDFMRRIVVSGLPEGHTDNYCKVAAESKEKESYFELEILLNEKYYVYGDEIWFVNKKKSGESDIYSLEEYNARFDQKIDKAYLEGRYGGVPVFNTVFPIREV